MDDQNQQNPLPPTPKHFFPKNKSIIIIISILSILSLSATGYILLANKKTEIRSEASTPQTLIISTPIPTIQPTTMLPTSLLTPTLAPTLSPTATWSAFVSSKYSYSIKYPPLWTAQIIIQQDPKILEYVVFNPVATKAGILSITLSYGTRTYSEALALDPQIGESVIVASVSARKKNNKDSNGNKSTNIIVPFGVNTIIFNSKDTYLSLFNQMLTTFKLTK